MGCLRRFCVSGIFLILMWLIMICLMFWLICGRVSCSSILIVMFVFWLSILVIWLIILFICFLFSVTRSRMLGGGAE